MAGVWCQCPEWHHTGLFLQGLQATVAAQFLETGFLGEVCLLRVKRWRLPSVWIETVGKTLLKSLLNSVQFGHYHCFLFGDNNWWFSPSAPFDEEVVPKLLLDLPIILFLVPSKKKSKLFTLGCSIWCLTSHLRAAMLRQRAVNLLAGRIVAVTQAILKTADRKKTKSAAYNYWVGRAEREKGGC